jgi:hypothetical protein
VRSLASTINTPPTTISRHLHTSGYVVRNLYIFPHILSWTQKAARVESTIELKKVLCAAKHYDWRYILTDDESWFYFPINPGHAWVPEGAVTPTRSRQTISRPKRMPAVFWSPLGFAIVQILSKGYCFNAEYFCNHILHELDRKRPATTDEDASRKTVLHFDNATPYTAAAS